MTDPAHDQAAAPGERLEELWHGTFGSEYTRRNSGAADKRQAFWQKLLGQYSCARVLEVGCNLGGNLKWIAGLLPPKDVYGIDINETALHQLRTDVPGINALWARARELPFRDQFFDLVFTAGVLIHQPPETLPIVMSEIVRCSRRYVLAAEYYSDTPTEVPYRGQQGALFKCDFGGLYRKLFPELKPVSNGRLGKEEGWDDVTWWLFERSR